MRMKKMNRGWPFSDENEMQEIKAVLESHTWWRGTGNKVKEFERCFANYHNVNYALGVSNGTHALEIALEVLGVMPGDEVIVPAFTFVATATAVLRRGAIPVFCDVDADTYCLMPESFNEKITNKTKAVIPVHMAGHLCDMEKISKVAMENNIRIIEDAAHAQGGEWNGKKVGFYSDIATYSFQNRKVMTCGEGGALITNSKELYDRAYLLHSVGRPPGDIIYEHLILGSNYRMSEFHAAILLCQLKRLANFTNLREKNAKKLNQYLEGIDGIVPQKFDEKCTRNTHYMYMFYYDKKYFGGMDKSEFIKEMNDLGIECHVPYPLVFNTTFFKKDTIFQNIYEYNNLIDKNFPNAAKISKEVVWIPHYELLCDDSRLKEITETILKIQSCNY